MPNQVYIDVHYANTAALNSCNIPDYLALLSSTEQQRYQEIKLPRRRSEFLLGRAMLRQQLSSRYGTSPQNWPIEPNNNGKPKLIDGSIRPDFSISHSKGLVACAITTHGPLGLDIEQINPNRNIKTLAARIFNTAERAWFDHPDTAIRTARFYQLWTLKEAWAKATETGVGAILKGVDLMAEQTKVQLFNQDNKAFFHSDETSNTANYWLCSFDLENKFAASLALDRAKNPTTPQLTLRNFLT